MARQGQEPEVLVVAVDDNVNDKDKDDAALLWELLQRCLDGGVDADNLLRNILSYLNTLLLVEMKCVNKNWSRCCTITIDDKLTKSGTRRRRLRTNEELRDAVTKYIAEGFVLADEFAVTLGWPIGKWDVSGVQNFAGVFKDCASFNEHLSGWNASQATHMEWMFHCAESFNQNINHWDVGRVTNMAFLFSGAKSFDQPLHNWNTSQVTDMSYMFNGAASFNLSLANWDTSNC